MENVLYSVDVLTKFGDKSISVIAQNVLDFDGEIDILTTSAAKNSYAPTKGTVFCALDSIGIKIIDYAQNPFIDLRKQCGVWLSENIEGDGNIKRISCVEMLSANITKDAEEKILQSIKAYFKMLDIAALSGVKMDTIVLPLLGTGRQKISENLMMIPMICECIDFLKRNEKAKKIYFVEYNQSKAFQIAQALKNSYSVNNERQRKLTSDVEETDENNLSAFISYSTPDRNVADNLCAKLEARGIKVWYAPRNVHGDYASSIADAIMKATHFVVIISKSSMQSEHVLNEIDLAFKGLPSNIKFKPLRIDDSEFAPAFNYYLSRQHWLDAYVPPLEQRLDEFVEDFFE